MHYSTTATTANTSGSSSNKGGSSSSNTTSKPASSMDTHPFARGSVIEVLHIENPNTEETFWWSDSDDDDEDENTNGDKNENTADNATDDDNNLNENNNRNNNSNKSIRLCDIIDRVALGNDNFRYYVHYRDFNRRMDEWIGLDRIVSPPSIGNAKARALKKQEQQQKKAHHSKDSHHHGSSSGGGGGVGASGGGAGGHGASHKRKSQTLFGNDPIMGDDSATPGRPRMTRRLRRSVSSQLQQQQSDDATVVASNTDGGGGGGGGASSDGAGGHNSQFPGSQPSNNDNNNNDKGGNAAAQLTKEDMVVKISTSAVAETRVGQHVVATIPAQELDEHEGLDEASLREHEEVTKVKNVETLELGEYRMNTWYFSPLPKELLSEKGFVETLYVCEFSFAMFSRKSELLRYQARPFNRAQRHPPGNEIYRNKNLSS